MGNSQGSQTVKIDKTNVIVNKLLSQQQMQGQKVINAIEAGKIDDIKINNFQKVTYINGDVFEGQFMDGVRQGQGKRTNKDGSVYEGIYMQDKPNGKGSYKWPNGDKYEGSWKDAQFSGEGTLSFTNGIYYKGQWQAGKPHGQGECSQPATDVFYTGEWANGLFNGQGKLALKQQGIVFTGEFKNGLRDGEGTKECKGIQVMQGFWKNNRLTNGKITYAKGAVYEGEWLGGKAHGKGLKIWPDGKQYIGMFRFGRPWGVGKKIHANGTAQDGFWDGVKFLDAKVIAQQLKWFNNTLLEDIKNYNSKPVTDPELLTNRSADDNQNEESSKGGEIQMEWIISLFQQGTIFTQDIPAKGVPPAQSTDKNNQSPKLVQKSRSNSPHHSKSSSIRKASVSKSPVRQPPQSPLKEIVESPQPIIKVFEDNNEQAAVQQSVVTIQSLNLKEQSSSKNVIQLRTSSQKVSKNIKKKKKGDHANQSVDQIVAPLEQLEIQPPKHQQQSSQFSIVPTSMSDVKNNTSIVHQPTTDQQKISGITELRKEDKIQILKPPQVEMTRQESVENVQSIIDNEIKHQKQKDFSVRREAKKHKQDVMQQSFFVDVAAKNKNTFERLKESFKHQEQDFINLPDGSYFRGKQERGEPNGHGVILTIELQANDFDILTLYEGNLVSGKADGYGVLIFDKGTGRYEGEWKRGKYEGQGIYSLQIGDATVKSNDQKIMKYEGEWLNGKMHGYGTFIWPNGGLYVGQWANNARQGYGKFYSGDCHTKYEGMWADGKYHGEGRLKERHKAWLSGMFKVGKYYSGSKHATDHDIWAC